ncbi:MAG TPA: hypothetical protein VFB66_16115 [Tepidisphaeraceae bacterium]|nr:hypothetical protein [Tepidisphaeraceae bacterium]
MVSNPGSTAGNTKTASKERKQGPQGQRGIHQIRGGETPDVFRLDFQEMLEMNDRGGNAE